MEIELSINIGKLSKLTENVVLNYWTYLHDDIGTTYNRFHYCLDKPLWECGPIKHEPKSINIDVNDQMINLDIPGLSVVLATT